MNTDTKKRFLLVIKKAAIIFLLGLIYYGFICLTGYVIPCIFNLATGLYCPGCGITRMFLSLAQFDFVSAAHNNLLVFSLLAPLIIYLFVKLVRYIIKGQLCYTTADKIAIIFIALAVLAFWIMRNMSQFSFLAPIPY